MSMFITTVSPFEQKIVAISFLFCIIGMICFMLFMAYQIPKTTKKNHH
jgi:hypothetical protein